MDSKFIITLLKSEDASIVRDTGCRVLAEYPDSLLVHCTAAQRKALQKAGLEVTELKRPTIRIAGTSFTLSNAIKADKAAPITPDPNRRTYYLMQLIGPAKKEWLDMTRALGGTIHGNLPGFTLLVGILPSKLQELESQPWVEAITPYRPAMKISHHLRPGISRKLSTTDLAIVKPTSKKPEERKQVEISVFPGESTAAIATRIRAGDGLIMSETQTTVIAVVPLQMIPDLANEQGIEAILPHAFPEFTNDRATPVIGIPDNRTFGNLTLQGTDQIVAVADSGIDTGDATTIHADFSGRVNGIVSFGLVPFFEDYVDDPTPHDDGPSDQNSGHGTHVAGSVLSNGAAAIAAPGTPDVPRGVAPQAQLYFQAVEQSVNWKSQADLVADGLWPVGWWWPNPWPPPAHSVAWGLPFNLNNLFDPAYTAGARIHTNSWGAPNAGVYNASSRQVDEFMWNHRDMLILFSAGNNGVDNDMNGVIDLDSIGTPGTAKNCVTVGASENNRPSGSSPTPGYNFNWTAWNWPNLGAAGHLSDEVDGMAAFSSRGPTDDGRIKPDVVAPGTNVLSVRSSVVGPNPLWGELPAAHALHGLYCWSGGTSMSTPLTAGAAALIRQHLVQQRGHFQNGVKPSGALIKAFLINGAESMTPGQFTAGPGTPPMPAEDEIPTEPNNVNGFGRVNLTEALTPGALGQTLFADEPDYAVETGQIRTFTVQVVDTTQPLKVTMVWTDAPGPADVGGVQNELYLQVRRPDLVVVDGDTTPFPNVTNNVQRVVIDTPAAGTYEIRVRGVSVNQQALGASPGTNPRQDFALTVSNGMGLSLQPVSIAQAIDTTGSMGSFGYMEPAKERAGQMIDFMRINDKVSITEFSQRSGVSNDARTPYSLRLLGNYNPDWTDAHAAIAGLYSNGRTPIGAGLQEAWNQLQTEPSTQPRAIILLSDGLNNEPPDPFIVLPGIPIDVPIFTIALGPAGSTTTLQNIANSRPNGNYYVVESDEDIHKLHEIYAQVQALATGANLVGLSSAEVESRGKASQETAIEPGVDEVTFTLSWDKSPEIKAMELIVTGPDNKHYNAKTAATIERRSSDHHLVRVAVPKAGKWSWTVQNYGSELPVKYTVSVAVQSRLMLSVETPKIGDKHLVLLARMRHIHKMLTKAQITARITMPTRSRKQVFDEFGDAILKIKLPKAVYEKGLNKEQILNLKLSMFAQRFRTKEGGIYGRKSSEVKMSPHDDNMWVAEVPIRVPGNMTVEIAARGLIKSRMFWNRYAIQSVHVPEATDVFRKLYL